jgi:glycerol-3-phosphate dehydrogenase
MTQIVFWTTDAISLHRPWWLTAPTAKTKRPNYRMVDDDSASTTPPTCLYDLMIVGGGVVGLAVLRAATLEGWNCVLVEREPDLLSHASGSNSGIVCTGVDSTPGTLERALIRDSISQLRPFCEALHIPIRPVGSLVCQWSWDKDETNSAQRLHRVLQESHEAGDTHAALLSPLQIQALEPNLASSSQSG